MGFQGDCICLAGVLSLSGRCGSLIRVLDGHLLLARGPREWPLICPIRRPPLPGSVLNLLLLGCFTVIKHYTYHGIRAISYGQHSAVIFNACWLPLLIEVEAGMPGGVVSEGRLCGLCKRALTVRVQQNTGAELSYPAEGKYGQQTARMPWVSHHCSK